ncbi:hypothetical protein [Chitinophaga nivalis]|uniref:Outer membrane protein beta-barrel domain-containing protein n=1 Tax=Chitinophaga nivalis TaxID=2991709 RepID=A0ABT3IIK6_9BACT|nr:hypothetical protein [Chitinophaga nivalis]MCW3466516.1 hypothetical protein [Chitinophaga nivalis]MCW3483793.1 hypothetical protein [Chitinophaga nivalis]
MKKKLLLLLLPFSFPLLVKSQIDKRLSRAYVGIMAHQGTFGGSVVNSFGVNRYFGVGAGVDITSFEKKVLVPFYADVRGRIQFNNFEPYIVGQFGKQLYTKDLPELRRGEKYNTTGKYFYGAGAGIAYKPGKIGYYISYIYRSYKYKSYSLGTSINGVIGYQEKDLNEGASVLSAGLIF